MFDGVHDSTMVLGDVLAIIIAGSDIRKVRSREAITIVISLAIISSIQRFVVAETRI